MTPTEPSAFILPPSLPSMSRTPLDLHRAELNRLLAFVTSFLVLAGGSYLVPGTDLVQPWVPGEPIPLISLITDPDSLRSQENLGGVDAGPSYTKTEDVELEAEEADLYAALAAASQPQSEDVVPVVAEVDALVSLAESHPEVEIPEMEVLAARALSADNAPSVSLHRDIGFDRGPTIPTAIEMGPGAMDAWFEALARVQAGDEGAVARVLHWGDSTIAGDGIARTIRRRLQTRFGDGGPGFLSVHVDRRWSARPGIARWPEGDWETKTITHGGREVPNYGLAGTVSTTTSTAHSVLGGYKIEGERQLLHNFEVYYQSQPGGGTLLVQPKGGETQSIPTHSDTVVDSFYRVEVPEGTRSLIVRGSGDGPVTLYGVSLETAGPGVTWETLGVAGASNQSMFRQNKAHFITQVAHRDPDLVIYQMGGNELGYPSLKRKGGKPYQDTFRKAVQRLKVAAPNASCLVISPLDQAEKYRGRVQSKEFVSRMVALQREAAIEEGCAFWSAWDSMGGQDSFARWMDLKLAWSDLYHLTNRGLNHVGHALSDAMEDAYGNWLLSQVGQAPLPPVESVAQAMPDGLEAEESDGLEAVEPEALGSDAAADEPDVEAPSEAEAPLTTESQPDSDSDSETEAEAEAETEAETVTEAETEAETEMEAETEAEPTGAPAPELTDDAQVPEAHDPAPAASLDSPADEVEDAEPELLEADKVADEPAVGPLPAEASLLTESPATGTAEVSVR